MNIAFGISWNDSKKGRLFGLLVALALVLPIVASPQAATVAGRAVSDMVSVVVRTTPGSTSSVEETTRELGGRVDRRIRIIHGFSARVPESRVAKLERSPGVWSVTPNAPVRMQSLVDGYDPVSDPGSMLNTKWTIKAAGLESFGITGAGVDVALLDSGVVPVQGLNTPGKVVNGPDLSFESGVNDARYLDTYGHGTFMAGIIAGSEPTQLPAENTFSGVAPGARIVNVKVADASGATDVSQVLAGIDWVVQHRNDSGLNIRVLNLSFGTDGLQNYLVDPLTYAAEVAWRKGIVVVVAAGNRGYGSTKLNNPAYDPYVIAVGAANTMGTQRQWDDTVPSWSSRGDGIRGVDLVAPGKSLVGLRDPGSYLDVDHPEGRVNSRFFRGSGTSQAAAVVSGVAALMLQYRPRLTPDQVKAILMKTATNLDNVGAAAQGAGEIQVSKAIASPIPFGSLQTFPEALGTGSLELARGTQHVYINGQELTGELTVFGTSWNGNSWTGNSWTGNSWTGGDWSGNSWSGNSWSGGAWNGNSWSGNSWSGNSWSGNSWSGNSWSGNSWSGNSWSGNSWSGNSWSGNSWSGNSWSSTRWGD